MKKIFILSILISLGMICSCQKQNSAAEQQLAQRKAELDAREQAINQREQAANQTERAVTQRDKVLAEKEKATTNARTILPGVQGQIPDPAQLNAQSDGRIQQLPADDESLIADPSQRNAEKVEKDRRTQELLAQRRRTPEEIERQRQRKFELIQRTMSGAAEATSATPSPTPR